MKKLKTPLTHEDIVNLKLGEKILLSGTIFAARDRAHQYFLDEDFNKIKEGVIYHCGPIIKDNEVISAGPTTSTRMNISTPKLIERYGIKAIIGKGGMDDTVLEAMNGKVVYLSAIGGAGVLYAKNMKIINVYKKEFGMPEAIWEFEIKHFPLIVTMDAHGKSLYKEIQEKSGQNFRHLIEDKDVK